ncbi:MAG: M14 family zinc carboxypeptidase [Bacteroidales bacterium]|nr:M14 family zinc carboxypeptidase [Bacteroidales bacterium]
MKKSFFTLVFILSTSVVLLGQGWRPGEMEVEVFLPDTHTGQKIAALHLNGEIYGNRAVLYVTPTELGKLSLLTNDFRITQTDMQSWAESFRLDRTAYHTYDEIISLADSLVTAFPTICRKYSFGTSVQNRQLAALKISDNVASDENEAEVMFDGGIHGDEIGASENVIRFARDLCLAYGNDDAITQLIDSREIWLYLMVNPDGRVNMVRYNANGIDINRDWPFMWNSEGASTGPASQPETKALRNCIYDHQFVIHTTYHSGTEYISCPWSYRASAPPDLPAILYLAERYAETSGYPSIPFGQGNTGMYPINGSSKDFNYGALGSVSWSMEISVDKQPPVSQLMYYYNINVPAMLAMIEYSGYGIEGLITDAETGAPVAASVFIDHYYPCFSDPEVGDFHKYLLPGIYEVTVKANGYEDVVISGVEVVDLAATVLPVTMMADPDQLFCTKVTGSHIPDNNTADEANIPAVIGQPDSIFYSVGKAGWITFDMGHTIHDREGDEIMIFEGDETPESYFLSAGSSIDGPWMNLGTGTGTSTFNLGDGNLTGARFLKITDDGDGQATAPDAGFDFDAAQDISANSEIYLLLASFTLSDEGGNNNGLPEPGEEITVSLSVLNNGIAEASAVEGDLICFHPEVTLTDPQVTFGDLGPGVSAENTFTLTLDASIPFGSPVALALTLTSGTYSRQVFFSFTAGNQSEDFESGDFNSLPWALEGSADWNIVTPGLSSDYCAASGTITDNQQSVLTISANVLTTGTITFNRKVSSESGYDFLSFSIDNQLIDQWSGTVGWSVVSYPVTAGVHTFKWTYAKDIYISNGSDKGWIDNITFPAVSFDHNGDLEGIVTDASTTLPLEGVSVIARHLSLYFAASDQTDAEGYYFMEAIPQGTYEVCFSASGYCTRCDTLEITGNQVTQHNAALNAGVGFSHEPLQTAHLMISPNPVNSGPVTLQWNGSKGTNYKIVLYNASGEEIFRRDGIKSSGGITTYILDKDSMNSIEKGLFFVCLYSENIRHIAKMIKW